MGVVNPRDLAYPECLYARYATVWDPLNDPLIVLVCSPRLTDYASSPKEHQSAKRSLGSSSREGAEWPRGLYEARMAPHGQNLGCRIWIVLSGSVPGSREAFRLWLRV